MVVLFLFYNTKTFSFLAPLPPNWGRANEWFPQVSIRGSLAQQAPDRDTKLTCVAGRTASLCPFIPSLDDVIELNRVLGLTILVKSVLGDISRQVKQC